MARIQGRQLDLRGTIPTFVYDLKDGEIMVADDGDLYVRSGDKIWKFDSDEIAVSTTTSTTTTSTTSTSTSTSTTSSTVSSTTSTSTTTSSSSSTTTTSPP